MIAHAFPTDLELKAWRIQRDAYAAFGGEAAVIYDKLRDELVLARQRLSDQEKGLATRLYLRAEVPQGRQGETLAQPPNPADETEAVYKERDEAEQQSAVSTVDPSPGVRGAKVVAVRAIGLWRG
jgi:hypothetical protein